MTFGEYLKMANQLIEKEPSLADYEIIHAADDEGNGYHKVLYTPTAGIYNEDIGCYESVYNGEDGELTEECTHICIN